MTLTNRIDFTLLFDVTDGNPNGDPDADNLPRFDTETGHGLITDVCMKRKVRNYVALAKEMQPPFDIYVKEKAILNDIHERAFKETGAKSEAKEGKRKGSAEETAKARDWVCANFYDVRTFGAVMSTGVNCGQVRGPVQFTFSRSFDPIFNTEHTITRMAVTTQKEAEKQDGDNRTMGRKHTVAYGLYKMNGFISAHLAGQTGFSEEDVNLLIEALGNMFDHDRSASRGLMTPRGLYLFRHESKLGNAPAHQLLERVTAKLVTPEASPRAFSDYAVSVNEENMPAGVTLERRYESPSARAAA